MIQQGDWESAKQSAHKLVGDAIKDYVAMTQPTPQQRYEMVRQNPQLFNQAIQRYGVERVNAWMKQIQGGDNANSNSNR